MPRINTPVAQEVHVDDKENIPTAVRVIEWEIIAERLFGHLDTAVRIVIAADNIAHSEERNAQTAERAATNEEIKIALIQSFGGFTGIEINTAAREQAAEDLRDAAQNHRNNAQNIRIAGLKFGVGYLVLVTGAEVIRWLYQQGLLHSAYHSIKNTVSGVKNAFVNGIRSIFGVKKTPKTATTPPQPLVATVVAARDVDNDGNDIEPETKTMPPMTKLFDTQELPAFGFDEKGNPQHAAVVSADYRDDIDDAARYTPLYL